MHGHRNGLKTAALLGLLTSLILLVGYWFGGTTGLVIAVLMSLGMNAATYFWSDKIALRTMGAQPVTEQQLPAALRRWCASCPRRPASRCRGCTSRPTPQPNAFATGRNPQNAAVCVTEGILSMLTTAELRGVIGHELSHVYNRDILISSVAGGARRHHHDAGPARLVHPDRPLRRRRRPRHARHAHDADPRPARGGGDPDGDQPQPGVPGRRRPAPAHQRPAGPGRARCGRSTRARRRCRCRPTASSPAPPT